MSTRGRTAFVLIILAIGWLAFSFRMSIGESHLVKLAIAMGCAWLITRFYRLLKKL